MRPDYLTCCAATSFAGLSPATAMLLFNKLGGLRQAMNATYAFRLIKGLHLHHPFTRDTKTNNHD